MTVTVTNAQREAPVHTQQMRQLAARTLRYLKIRTRGTVAVTFLGARAMRRVNQRFGHHDTATDVLSFRYDGEPTCLPPRLRGRQVVGEIFVAPRIARRYAKAHGLSYREELARYVIHGLLHWAGHEDRTLAQQQKMRAMEDCLLNISNCELRIANRKNGQSEIRNPKSAIRK